MIKLKSNGKNLLLKINMNSGFPIVFQSKDRKNMDNLPQ